MDLAEGARYGVRMPVAHWLIIDATLDNEISVPVEPDDEDEGVEMASAIRKAGWAALPDWPQDEAGFATWPRPGRTVTVALTQPQWHLVLAALERWAAVSDDSATPRTPGEAMEHVIAEQLRRRLARHE